MAHKSSARPDPGNTSLRPSFTRPAAGGGRSSGGRLGLTAIGRAVSWHRRKLAVVAAVAAVLTGVSAALPPDPPSVEVVRAVGRIDGGDIVAEGDITVERLPKDALPDGALTDASDVIGRTLTAAVPRGQVLTALNLMAAGRTARAGLVVAPLRIADSDVVTLLRSGDTVDVVAADGQTRRAQVLARRVRVFAVPAPPDSSGVTGSASSSTGSLVLVEVAPDTATLLAKAAVTSTLSVIFR